MAGWDQVKWAQARQVADLIDLDVSLLGDPDADPESGYRALRERGDLNAAVRYLGHALPRFEAVAWAAHLLQEWSRSAKLGVPEQQALDSAMRWLEEPTDEYRRAAHETAEMTNGPERLLGYAVFMSGGSISEVDLPPVHPQQHICGSLAASAVLAGAYRTANPGHALGVACDTGEEVATVGTKALSPP